MEKVHSYLNWHCWSKCWFGRKNSWNEGRFLIKKIYFSTRVNIIIRDLPQSGQKKAQ